MDKPEAAIFLAAGRGLRLGARGREIPKGFLEIGGEALVERAIGHLRAAGIAEIVLVTGHLAEQYDALAARLGGGVRTVFNPHFATRGSGWSLAAGLAATRGDAVLLESDLIWERAALAAILAAPAPSTLLASGPTAGGDEVWVWADGDARRPVLGAMSKRRDLRPEAPFGELVGLTRIGAALRDALVPTIEGAVAADPMADYESCLVAAGARAPVDLLRLDDLAWAEIDDETMLARAVAEVVPRIRAREAAATRG